MINSKAQRAVPQPVLVNVSVRKTGFVSTSLKEEINWWHVGMLVLTPLFGLIGLIFVPIRLPTIIWGIIMYLWSGLGITAGYHRLWSHRAFSATYPVRLFLCLGGSAAYEGSAKWWCRNHRAHHRYTDTNRDPYNAKRGFFYAHLGWMLVKQNIKEVGYADITDLQRDPMLQWQHKYYAPLAIGIGIVFPVAVASLWGDALGGFFFACMWRMVFVHHATFFVNSLAHYLGDKTYSDHHTAFDSFVTALLTLGEGYHNYHHEFPQDYRNGIRFFHYDPTKWFISILSLFKGAYNLKRITPEEIDKARLQMAQRRLDNEKAKAMFGKKYDELPTWTWEEYQQKVQAGACLVVISDLVHNVETFVQEHPGGRQTLLNWVGTDATEAFNGKEPGHEHSKEARSYLNAMRIAKLKPKNC